MPGWESVLQEIHRKQIAGQQSVDRIRRNYLAKLHKYTKRNVIAYYSGWLVKPVGTPNTGIGDEDKSGFMAAVRKLDRTVGLDLIIHTPGGGIAATESLVDYLWKMFDQDIRVIVPQIAMSAGTMIACSAKTILMGKQSNLGPIDPQFGNVAAQAVLDEFAMAIEQINKDPSSIPLWQTIIGKYHPTFLLECKQAIEWSGEMVKDWLCKNMFAEDEDADSKADAVVKFLSDHAGTKTHSRHISMAACQEKGLKIEELEADNKLQDLVLTIHHAYTHTFSQTPAIKIIENHKGVASVLRIVQG
ncbi:MAG: S49 family peptidase [Magnetococcales bacterium]|nr:S49 family peptidase [Magnetococcales bacterium]